MNICSGYIFQNRLKLNKKTVEVYQVEDDAQTFLVHAAAIPNNEKNNSYILYKVYNNVMAVLKDFAYYQAKTIKPPAHCNNVTHPKSSRNSAA